MKLVIFAGTPGCGKTSIIKHIIGILKEELSIKFIKFDCLKSSDDKLIADKYNVSTDKKLSEELCPDHYTALELSRIIQQNQDKDLMIVETAGLCLRCSPYVKEGLGINILDITSGNPNRYGPILTHADIVAISKGDLISQAEREIFRFNVIDTNPKARILEINGLTGEGASDLAEYIKYCLSIKGKKLTLKHSMPSAVCGFCYGNKLVDQKSIQNRFVQGKEIKSLVPNLNCGRCGLKSCNEFIRSVLDKKIKQTACPFVKKKLEKN